MQFDPIATSVVLLVASAAMAIGLLAASARQPGAVGEAQRAWSLALMAGPLGWTLLEFGALMRADSLAVAAKTVLAGGFSAYLFAVMRLRELHRRLAWTLLPVVLVLMASLLFVWRNPDQPMRTGLLSLICALLAAACAWRVRGAAGRSSSPQAAWVTVAFAGSAVVLALRAAALFAPAESAAHQWATSPFGHCVLLGVAMVAPAAATAGFVMMGSDRLIDRWAALASTDELTGLLARREFLTRAERSLRDAREQGRHLALLMVDIDHFKRINDRFGHAVGDQALRAVADCLRSGLRGSDEIGRLGGEEFAVLLPGVDLPSCERIAQGLRADVARIDLRAHGMTLPLRVSIGATVYVGGADSVDAMLERADRGLYDAKRHGRDRVTLQAV